jgi:hypothetical protein
MATEWTTRSRVLMTDAKGPSVGHAELPGLAVARAHAHDSASVVSALDLGIAHPGVARTSLRRPLPRVDRCAHVRSPGSRFAVLTTGVLSSATASYLAVAAAQVSPRTSFTGTWWVRSSDKRQVAALVARPRPLGGGR